MARFVLGVDSQTHFALAFYDIDRPERFIDTVYIPLSGLELEEKLDKIIVDAVPEIRHYGPLYAVVEKPLPFTRIEQVRSGARAKRARKDMFPDAGEGAAPPTKAAAVDIKALYQNCQTAGCIYAVLRGLKIPTIQAYPREWQSIMPPHFKKSRDAKDNAKMWAGALNIVNATNEHTRDAALIAIYAAGRYQEYDLKRRSGIGHNSSAFDQRGFDL